jgi:hypothetical protein
MFANTYTAGFYMGASAVITVCLAGSVYKSYRSTLKKIDEVKDCDSSSHYTQLK